METFLTIALIVIVIVVVGIVLLTRYTNKKRCEDLERRRAALLAKYHDPQIVDKIMRHMFCQDRAKNSFSNLSAVLPTSTKKS